MNTGIGLVRPAFVPKKTFSILENAADILQDTLAPELIAP
jgi:hypothetical protein